VKVVDLSKFRTMAFAVMAMLGAWQAPVNLRGVSHIPFGTSKGGNAQAKRAATKARNVKRHRASLKG
jgi:hypothetical protein